MNKYSINIYGENCIKIEADRIEEQDGALLFFREDTLIAKFIKWQYWTCDEKIIKPLDIFGVDSDAFTRYRNLKKKKKDE